MNSAAPILMMTLVQDFVDKNIGLWVTRIGALMFGIFGLVALVQVEVA